jgi:hypothetical protein
MQAGQDSSFLLLSYEKALNHQTMCEKEAASNGRHSS